MEIACAYILKAGRVLSTLQLPGHRTVRHNRIASYNFFSLLPVFGLQFSACFKERSGCVNVLVNFVVTRPLGWFFYRVGSALVCFFEQIFPRCPFPTTDVYAQRLRLHSLNLDLSPNEQINRDGPAR